MTIYDLALLAGAALVAAYIVLVLVVAAVRPLRGARAAVSHGFSAPFISTFDQLGRESRMHRLEEEVQRALGQADGWGSQERAEIVDAALAAQQITILNQNLRKSVHKCLNTHWAVAQGLATPNMSEAARHPWCQGLRQRVIDLSELLSQRLERYPLVLDAPELIRLQLGIRWIGPTCATCPYWTATTETAPRICPTAKAMGQRPSSGNHSVVDGEILDTCDTEPR